MTTIDRITEEQRLVQLRFLQERGDMTAEKLAQLIEGDKGLALAAARDDEFAYMTYPKATECHDALNPESAHVDDYPYAWVMAAHEEAANELMRSKPAALFMEAGIDDDFCSVWHRIAAKHGAALMDFLTELAEKDRTMAEDILTTRNPMEHTVAETLMDNWKTPDGRAILFVLGFPDAVNGSIEITNDLAWRLSSILRAAGDVMVSMCMHVSAKEIEEFAKAIFDMGNKIDDTMASTRLRR